MIDALQLTVVMGGVAASVFLAARALRTFCRGAVEATHGTTSGVQRLRALRLRIYTLTGLLGVALGALAIWQSSFSPGSALWPAGVMLAFGFFADVSARASGRASQPGDKRAHVEARMRAHRHWQKQQRRHREGRPAEERKQPHRSSKKHSRKRSKQYSPKQPARATRQSQRRRALQALGLPEDADAEEVKRAWRRHAFRHHPDRHLSAGEARRKEHARSFHRARRAYETLCDEHED